MKISLQAFFRILLLISIPALYFYPFTVTTFVFSVLLALSLKSLIGKKRGYINILLFMVILLAGVFASGYQIDHNVAINNVTNSQRGEHPNFQTNIFAKILHNKTTSAMFYLQNLNDRLSISSVFVAGSYPNLSKYLPLGFLFPWYLVGFVLALKRKYPVYLRTSFLTALSILLILTSIFSRTSSEIFMFALIWFTCLESVEQLIKSPKIIIYLLVVLNLIYLGIFLASKNVFLNI